jgi:hypothetical protein
MALLPGYTLIGEFADLNYVALLRSRFDAAGIEHVVLDEYRTGSRGFPIPGPGIGARVLVRDAQVTEAREILRDSVGVSRLALDYRMPDWPLTAIAILSIFIILPGCRCRPERLRVEPYLHPLFVQGRSRSRSRIRRRSRLP